ncbi:IS3 family transposase, partial [Candidatus Gracilibacteria bacterium]|nr:IS3 family transposase [Candidatus Gracilibacteria bacterium]
HAEPVAPNRLARQFSVAAPDRAWVTDSTSLPTREGWRYLAVVLDLFARRVVGWALRPTLERELVVAALQDAIRRRQPPPGLLHHRDRGRQYASTDYQAVLRRAGMTARMRRRGNGWDTAAMESFFATLKAELPVTVFATHANARAAVFDYIERFYNRKRVHSTRAYRTPLRTEQDWQASQRATGACVHEIGAISLYW